MRELLSILIVAALSISAIAQDCVVGPNGIRICNPRSVVRVAVAAPIRVAAAPVIAIQEARQSYGSAGGQSYGSTGSSYSGGSSGSAGYRPSSGGYYGSMAMVRAASDQNTWVAVHLRNDHGVDTSGMTLAQMEARHAQIHAMEGRRAWRPRLFGRWR